MELKNYSLKYKDNILFENVNIIFKDHTIHHILGKNGSGKSSFAKSILGAVGYTGTIDTKDENFIVIGSYTNIPNEYKVNDILQILQEKYNFELYKKFSQSLDISSISLENKLGSLSDGQKQKLKLLFFMANSPKLVILDEFTSALDKKTSIDVYKFLNDYVKNYKATLINITHNLSDLKYMPGTYNIVKNKNILGNIEMNKAIDFYINGVDYEE
ncbi:MAG: ATP-binding cassette domain-containing protein [Peptoniphilaceae bacterium]|nr:ATP-binding cassette domain-containing protein [Peptoniphilaceae bacterium]MDY6018483.1 ATP-binding cassette domain-containing protein [Anaerococcus sp.]